VLKIFPRTFTGQENKKGIKNKNGTYSDGIGSSPMENEPLRDLFGLGVVLVIIGAAQIWSALLGA
jgi:hypothetical protein